MSIRGRTGKFFYDRIHDLYLYYLTLEAGVYSEEKGDFITTHSGAIKMEGGWSAIAKKMTEVFGRHFSPGAVHDRYEKLDGDYLDSLFNDVMDFRDNLERLQIVSDA